MQSPHPTPPASTQADISNDAALQRPTGTPLSTQPVDQPCLLQGLQAEGRLGQRLADMGFVPGLLVRVVRRAPLGDPLEVDLAGVRLCIRAEEARQVLVTPLEPGKGGVRP